MKQWLSWLFLGMAFCALLVACQNAIPPTTPTPTRQADVDVGPPVSVEPTESLQDQADLSATPPSEPTAVPTPANTPSPTPFALTDPSPPCGVQLPLQVDNPPEVTVLTNTMPTAMVPEAALPALQQLWDAPEAVGLVAYRIGDAANGIFLNANATMPVASVSKLIHLVAYAQAVDEGFLDPNETVSVDFFNQFYLPGSDLGSHRRAMREVEVQPDNTFLLSEVPNMMMEYSSNSATDYLHWRLGQARIEQTVINMGVTNHTAPCYFLGQFLAMGNHERTLSDLTAFREFGEDNALYGAETARLADWFIQNEAFRSAESRWGGNNPSIETQYRFSQQFGTHGTPLAYAIILENIIAGNYGSAQANAIIRNALEWPLEEFQSNQELFTTIGFKNGRLPGVATTVYYAWPWGESLPTVVVLFYRDLPLDIYQEWRSSLAHDDLARWFLYDSNAIPLIRQALIEGQGQ